MLKKNKKGIQAAAGVAVVLGATTGLGLSWNLGGWVALITTFTTATAAFVFAGRYSYLGLSYQSTARRLEWLLAQWDNSGKTEADKQAFVTTFSGSHHYIIDYLVDEVMSRQPQEVQKFLYQTSVFNRFCAPLSDAVLEISHSKRIIHDIDEANLFLVRATF